MFFLSEIKFLYKKFFLFFSGKCPFLRLCTLVYKLHFILCHLSLGLSNSPLTFQWWAHPFLYVRCLFFMTLHLGIQISLYPASPLFWNQQQLSEPPVKTSSLSLWKKLWLLLCNVLTLSYLDTLWFGTHPYYSLNPYVHLSICLFL